MRHQKQTRVPSCLMNHTVVLPVLHSCLDSQLLPAVCSGFTVHTVTHLQICTHLYTYISILGRKIGKLGISALTKDTAIYDRRKLDLNLQPSDSKTTTLSKSQLAYLKICLYNKFLIQPVLNKKTRNT